MCDSDTLKRVRVTPLPLGAAKAAERAGVRGTDLSITLNPSPQPSHRRGEGVPTSAPTRCRLTQCASEDSHAPVFPKLLSPLTHAGRAMRPLERNPFFSAIPVGKPVHVSRLRKPGGGNDQIMHSSRAILAVTCPAARTSIRATCRVLAGGEVGYTTIRTDATDGTRHGLIDRDHDSLLVDPMLRSAR